ncbi:MAG: metal-dependent phosphohydrolase [Cyanobacteria bacterium RU_5_0]|nr:metal-dependent phosphohydrolase [Cyanobacteria bacterium RU_5_0]
MLSTANTIRSIHTERLQTAYYQTFGQRKPEYIELIERVAIEVLDHLAQSPDPYHNAEHTLYVTWVGQEILRGKHLREDTVSPEDWLHVIVSLLCHDIGYLKGACYQDCLHERRYATGIGNEVITLSSEATETSLSLWHVDRSKQFVEQRFRHSQLVNVDRLKQNIEFTRFPIPTEPTYQDTEHYPGLTRAADLIGQMSDPDYLKKTTALFYEFEETGLNQQLGYRRPEDVCLGHSEYYRTIVYPYIQTGLAHLEAAPAGNQIIARLYTNLFVAKRKFIPKCA